MKSEKERKWKEVIDILRDYSGFEDLLEEERSRTINDIADWLNGLAKGEIYDGTDKKLVNALDNLLRSTNQKIVSKIKTKIKKLNVGDSAGLLSIDNRAQIRILQQFLKEVDEK